MDRYGDRSCAGRKSGMVMDSPYMDPYLPVYLNICSLYSVGLQRDREWIDEAIGGV